LTCPEVFLIVKEDFLNPKNYRPVAIVPIFSKVFERVIFNQLVTYLAENEPGVNILLK
jgi:hypothetical protein